MPVGSVCAVRVLAQEVAALNGGRDRLTDEELEFVGVGTSRRSKSWHEPKTTPYDVASDPGERRLEFLS